MKRLGTPALRGPGRHWFLILKLENHFEVFDSLGISEGDVKSRLGTAVKKCFFNTSPVQAEDSVLCGQFCCYFALVRLFNADLRFAKVVSVYRCEQLSLGKVLNSYFTADLAANEEIVRNFFATGELPENNDA